MSFFAKIAGTPWTPDLGLWTLDFGLKVLIFDQLKKNDPQLRLLTLVMLGGLALLLAGLWWVQIVSARDYQANLETQSFRIVRYPAVRGRILDRNGAVLAENRPIYNVNLYLDELRRQFDKAYAAEAARAKTQLAQQMQEAERKLGRKLSSKERKQFTLNPALRNSIRQRTRYDVASNVVMLVSQRLQQPLSLDYTNFERHYERRLALPYPVLTNLSPAQIARFEEQSTSPLGVDLEIQSMRVYPGQTTAAHVLGYLLRDDSSMEGEDAFFSYRLPDYRGKIGIEFGFDSQLHGRAGAKSVLVNNLGYRQTENIWTPSRAGPQRGADDRPAYSAGGGTGVAERARGGRAARRGRGHGRAHRRHPGAGLRRRPSTRTASSPASPPPSISG